MISFRTWLETAEEHIKVHLPSVRQSHDYDCGAAALRAVCEHFKVGPRKEADFIKACRTGKKTGTRPKDILRCAADFGLETESKSGMTVEELKSHLDLGRPVICCVQAYGDDKEYDTHHSGHYVVAIGYDDKHVYFEDPTMEGTRGFLPYKEFEGRWHDKDADGRVFKRLGIILWKQSGEGTDREFLGRTKRIP